MGEVCVECTGEGVVLIDPATAQVITADRARRPSRIETARTTIPPPAPRAAPFAPSADPDGAIELDVIKKADWLSDDDDDKSGTSGGKSADTKRDEI